MGAETAISLAAPKGPSCDEKSDRTRRLGNIADALRLYEELERALAQLDDEALMRVGVAVRRSAPALSRWARRLAVLREVTRTPRLDIEIALSDLPPGTSRMGAALRHRSQFRTSLVWEALAFAIGCAVSLLLI